MEFLRFLFLNPILIIGTKRKSVSTTSTTPDASAMDRSTPAKQASFSLPIINDTIGTLTDNKTCKSKLNELAQKNKLNQPTYDTVHTPNGFFTTVTFNGRQFKVR